MDTDKKKRTLREAYDAALRGEEFQIREKLALKRLQSTRYRAGTFGMGAASMAVIVALVSMSIAWPDSYESSVWTMVAGFILPLGSGYAGNMLAWRMLRGNVLEQSFVELRACPADQDGVKRTDTERGMLRGALGIAYALVNDTRRCLDRTAMDFQRAKTVSSDSEGRVAVGNALAKCERQLSHLEIDLESVWQRPDSTSALASVSVARRCQEIAGSNIGTYMFVYTWGLDAP